MKKAKEDMRVTAVIMKYVKDNPDVVQNDLKQAFDIDDGKMISNLCSWVEKYGIKVREKDGKNYKPKMNYESVLYSVHFFTNGIAIQVKHSIHSFASHTSPI